MDADGPESHGPVSDGHPDLDTLADANAAALDPPLAAEILGHATVCATCTAVLDALRAVRSDLATLPRPPVPAGVAARLDAVLDVERRGRSGSGPAAVRATDGQAGRTDPAGAAGEPVRSAAGDVLVFAPTRRRRSRRWLGWAVAAALVVGGGGVAGALALTGGGGAGTGVDDTTVAAGTMSRPSPARSPGRGHGMPIGPQHEGSGPGDTTGTVPTYTRDDIEEHLAAILAAGSPCDDGSCQGLADDPSRCASELGDEGVTGAPRAVQFAFFEGTPALVFVFDDDRIVVVGSDCGGSASPTILFRDH